MLAAGVTGADIAEPGTADGPRPAQTAEPGSGGGPRPAQTVEPGAAGGSAAPRIGELGTGVGIGAAWLASAMPPGCTCVTAEIDPALAAVARQVLAGDPRVEVITGDATVLLGERAPFDLLFADCLLSYPVDLVDMIRIGGRIVQDDVTPLALLPPDSPYRVDDPKRRFFKDPRLVSTEVILEDLRNSLLVGTRVS